MPFSGFQFNDKHGVFLPRQALIRGKKRSFLLIFRADNREGFVSDYQAVRHAGFCRP